MRGLTAVVLVLALSGCLGFFGLGGPERGGWSVFAGGISCRDCESLSFSTGKGVFEVEHTFDIPGGRRIEAWYESPIEVGQRFVLTWYAPLTPTITTRTAHPGGGWDDHKLPCESDAPPPEPPPTVPVTVSDVPGPAYRCVLDHTPPQRLEAPDNGITIIWTIENGYHANATVAFGADFP